MGPVSGFKEKHQRGKAKFQSRDGKEEHLFSRLWRKGVLLFLWSSRKIAERQENIKRVASRRTYSEAALRGKKRVIVVTAKTGALY